MDRQRAKELLPILEAFANGKVIQARSDYYRDPTVWHDLDDYVAWDEREDEEYRIKPEPRQWWIHPTAHAKPIPVDGPAGSQPADWIKVCEVL